MRRFACCFTELGLFLKMTTNLPGVGPIINYGARVLAKTNERQIAWTP